MVATFHRIPVIPMPYVDEQARILSHRMQRRPLMLDMFVINRWLFHQDFLSMQAALVKKSQPATPQPQPFCYSTVAFHGWRKLAWVIVGLLDNVCHIGRVGA